MMADGRPDDLVRDPKRSFPSFISAATMLDMVNSPSESRDFWGTQMATANPGIAHIHCPLLAFFGTRDDVGGEATLELLKSSIRRQSSGPSRVDTTMIQHADHMYTGEEVQVAEAIAKWQIAFNEFICMAKPCETSHAIPVVCLQQRPGAEQQ